MALTGITLDQMRTYGKEKVILSVEWAVGATGAVGTVTGDGWGTGVLKGSVTRDGVGVYTVVMPGSGSLAKLQLISAHVLHASDVRLPVPTARSLSARSITLTLYDLETPAATEASNGAVVIAHFLVQNTTVR